MSKTKKAKKQAGVRSWDELVSPIIAHAQANPGFDKMLGAAMEARFGIKRAWRQLVYQWLHPDPAKRPEPRYTVGVVILEESARLMASTSEG